MKKKVVIASVLLSLVLVPQGFSSTKGYIKATLGGGYTTVDVTAADVNMPRTLFDAPVFTVKPAIGVEWKVAIFALALEASVGLGFGNDSGLNSSLMAVDPGLMGIFSLHLWKFVPYVGIGVSVPMVFSGDNVYFTKDNRQNHDDFGYSAAVNALVGFGFNVTRNIMPTLELEGRWGFVPYETTDLQARVGCMIRFGR